MLSAETILKDVRARAGLSQRALAAKARTAQSVVARIELGETSPSWDTLMRLVRASGFSLRASVEPIPTVDQSLLDDIPRILRMTPEQRLDEVAQVSKFLASSRRV